MYIYFSGFQKKPKKIEIFFKKVEQIVVAFVKEGDDSVERSRDEGAE